MGAQTFRGTDRNLGAGPNYKTVSRRAYAKTDRYSGEDKKNEIFNVFCDFCLCLFAANQNRRKMIWFLAKFMCYFVSKSLMDRMWPVKLGLGSPG